MDNNHKRTVNVAVDVFQLILAECQGNWPLVEKGTVCSMFVSSFSKRNKRKLLLPSTWHCAEVVRKMDSAAMPFLADLLTAHYQPSTQPLKEGIQGTYKQTQTYKQQT